ncbi:2-aminoadipate transaminase [Oikeobacillus pervagus]|uniref:2-aminoadipate transaminase n=1 Tax=Oikeobacillus pervagus TaxID=1325931 RepID=A0AAJ1WIG0_9BACI|nr:PLP-dependent aminotransferase family protein [Oikeobacillus pervagus]MDQ0214383.1 2-aminoadipate transaminase [Oikeobacillus pervagus]
MNYRLAARTKHLTSSAVRDILKVINEGNVISFAGGLPDDALFPVEPLRVAFEKTLQSGHQALQYGVTEGFVPLREVLVDRLARKGIVTNVDRILLTTGSQQAIDLFSRVMFDPGDVVLTEDPTYLAALQVFKSYEAKVISVQSDDFGMILDDLEEKIRTYHPKAIYIVPTFSNPVGKVWTLERRQALLQLAKEHDVIIFEDDPYGEIQFHEEEITPIAALDDGTTVLYTSTFSKTVVPALRSGWISGPIEIMKVIAQAKQGADLHSSLIDQEALYYLLQDFDIEAHIQKIRSEYKFRMNLMLDELKKINMDGLSYGVPRGGMFFWVRMPEEISTTKMLDKAIGQGFAYVPGAPFYVNDPKENTLRLNFSHPTPVQIREGMKSFVNVFSEALQVY